MPFDDQAYGSSRFSLLPSGIAVPLGGIVSVVATAGLTGWTSVPDIVIAGGGGTGAAATVVLKSQVVTGVYVTAYGSSYDPADTTPISATVTGLTLVVDPPVIASDDEDNIFALTPSEAANQGVEHEPKVGVGILWQAASFVLAVLDMHGARRLIQGQPGLITPLRFRRIMKTGTTAGTANYSVLLA